MRFNKTVQPTKTVNLAGGEAYQESPKLELVSILLTSFVKDQFYRTADDGLARFVELIGQIPDKRFVAKAALYARTKYGMRSISHVAAAHVGQLAKGENWTRPFFRKIVHRPDDMLEILAYYRANCGKAIPNAMKDGFAARLASLDSYQLAKYRGEGKAINLYDLVNLCHPKATPALTKLMTGELAPAETWEVKLTQAGQKAEEKEELKREAWEDLIGTRKIGYFALLRNLRNIIEQSPGVLDQALDLLVDEKLIRKSLLLPFRFSTALEEVVKLGGPLARKAWFALSKAVDISLANVPRLEGRTLVALDGSGSMRGQPWQIGALFAAVLYKTNDADLLVFSYDAAYQAPNPADSTLGIAGAIHFPNGGTSFHAIFQQAKFGYERIVILSDMQAWIGYDTPAVVFKEYCRRYGCRPKLYSWDLAGVGTLQFPEPNVYCLAGFSEKVFDVMRLLETDKHALIAEIEAVEL